MQLVGYSNQWSARRGETVRFFVSSAFERYDARLVRLIHGDDNPHGPGLKTVGVPSAIDGSHPGTQQEIFTGSYVRIEPGHAPDAARGFTLLAWLRATASERGEQGLITQWDAGAKRGFGLFVSADTGRLEARLGLRDGTSVALASARDLRPHDWYFAAFVFNAIRGTVSLRTEPIHPNALDAPREVLSVALGGPVALAADAPLLLGAGSITTTGGRAHATACLNGRLSAPGMLARAVSLEELRDATPEQLCVQDAAAWLARWDLSHDMGGRSIPDRSGQGCEGRTVNRPTRAVTGHNWSAHTDSFVEAPAEYNAIHFHDDDLEDAGWTESFHYEVPVGLKSGIYAVELTGPGGTRDFIPFFVRPETGRPEAAIAVLLPTLSYLAYSNEALDLEAFEFLAPLCPLRNMGLQRTEYAYMDALWLKSTYNHHRDGTGICHSTMLRPSLTSMRPTHRGRLYDGPHQLSADLHLIDWLEEKQIPYDVITDHDLHREGAAVLAPYRAVLTGTHAEYWSVEMLDGLESYQQHGGRFIYLSGNGLYWVTALDRETQTICEIRRPNGTRAWHAAPGEGRISFTGEPGGIWAWRGRPPQRYVGVGFAAQGFDRGVPYRRTAASHDPRCAFLFAGIDDELIGNFPALVMNHGAAGYEVDRADHALGTPAHALVVASSTRLSDSYQYVVEEIPAMMPHQGGLTNPNVRADMVYYETPGGGAVFSVGSISFCSALSYNGYDNNVSRLLENAVRAFSDPAPLSGHRPG